jgi:hypothetical protein
MATTGVIHIGGSFVGPPAEARLPNGAITGLAVRFNALCGSDGGFNPRRPRHAPNLNDTRDDAVGASEVIVELALEGTARRGIAVDQRHGGSGTG